MGRKENVYEIKYTQNKKASKKYVTGAKERDKVLSFMKRHSGYSKVSSKIYKN